ncbi:uncharacterized protein LOC143174166 isoform X2 [Nomia melanderi]|nr:uncharacterized protein LOC116432423 isoform X2 [Nomia melanderi]XP_031845144.1 uncharacterized protein LOC116432423 isoform X2 [Nomia melanderi]XP_031845145.1 uncharacterized protein LOC116432423 isoform X2 [Nomia melanderi]XP_031845146.1 uncharacterized protein LOC116432423 isoform X2 [Nomia melanderi]XP_031845147.1 uncharacterized protein LOC116432423 isoform X2 [Nomia melanderi]XP_031845148.1 uncharacterized protein LOC116432423 isoform X2 [Nomia melanderi]XP_031845149.1 uncharacterize
MEEKRIECALCVLYLLSAILSLTSLTSFVTVWQHWTRTLNVCISIDCGCILYSINTFSTFMGGDVKLCQFGAYGSIPAILIGLCLGGYHAYRCCIHRNLDKPVQVQDNASRNLQSDVDRVPVTVVARPKRRSRYKHWIPVVFLATLFSCLLLAHAIVMTDGYYKTCEQFRKRIIQEHRSVGGEAEMIHNRFSCGAIFDFMDFAQVTEDNWIRGKQIDTGAALRLAVVSAWLSFFVWTLVFLLSVSMVRQKLCRC